jgi:CheY-like chemotaxis protein
MEPETVLIVDDHADTREGLRHVLEGEGFTVHAASNGLEALTLLYRGLRPCVIVMDLMMPVMNGFEFRQEQLKHSDIADIPFIAYSAVVDIPAHALTLQATDYFQKPIEVAQVMTIIRRHCPH